MRYDMPSVETKRLLLRPLEEADACDMFAYLSLVEVTQYLSFPPHPSVDHTLHMLHKVMLPYAQQQDFETWAIVWKENDRMIGHLHLHSLQEDRAQLGYVLHPAYWGKGIMSEALKQLLQVAFHYCGLHRVEALYEVHHLASEKVLQKCGFIKEGILRSYVKLHDECYHDMVIMAMIDKDYNNEGEHTYEKRITTEI